MCTIMTSHFTFLLHDYDLTVISGGGGMVVEEVPRSVTVDRDRVSTFVSVKPVDSFKVIQ